MRSSCVRFPLLLITVFTLAYTSHAKVILEVVGCNLTNVTIQLSGFPPGPLVAELGGNVVTGTYDYAAQRIVLVRPPGLAGGTYLLRILKTSNSLLREKLSFVAATATAPARRDLPVLRVLKDLRDLLAHRDFLDLKVPRALLEPSVPPDLVVLPENMGRSVRRERERSSANAARWVPRG
jgi:hypothetical protein